MGGVDIKKLKQEILQADNPVGCLRLQVVNTNPAEYLGFGEWVLWGKGKVPVGVDTDDTDFNTVEKEIGSKTKNIPNHNHNYKIGIPYYYAVAVGEKSTECGVYDYTKNKYVGFSNDVQIDTIVNSSLSTSNKSTNVRIQKSEGKTSSAGSTNINVIQPSITCYMFKRVK